jgi:hypothetical protein
LPFLSPGQSSRFWTDAAWLALLEVLYSNRL